MKKVTSQNSDKELENVKEGDVISDNHGQKGEVEDVQIVHWNEEKQYYYKIKNDGTILVIK